MQRAILIYHFRPGCSLGTLRGGEGALKSQVLENANTENVSTNQDFVQGRNATTENASVSSQDGKHIGIITQV